jgi:hypothetical protein
MAIDKKTTRIIIITLLVLICVNSIIFLWARHGWRLWGFKDCGYPSGIYIKELIVNEDHILIKGSTGASAGAYVGYITEISDRKLYIGLKYNVLFGFLKQNGSFDYKIPFDRQRIDEIYLANEIEKRLIWLDETSDMNGNNIVYTF